MIGWLWDEAMMTYKTAYASHQVQKMVHGGLHLIGLVLGIVGICAAFRFHDKVNLKDMVSLHSWIGLTTFILLGVQVIKLLYFINTTLTLPKLS